MSVTNILKSAVVVLFGGLLGYNAVHLINQPSSINRQLASATFSKLGTEQFARNLFDVKIKNESIALTQDAVSTIRVTIEAYKSFPTGLLYRWNLPESAIVVEGPIEGSLYNFAENQTKEFTLKVKGYSKEIRNYISFSIKGELDQKKIERDVLASSRPEDSFEYVVQQYEKSKTESSNKLNKLGPSRTKAPVDINKVSF